MADLPAARLQLHKLPFFHVSVDCFGALRVKINRSQAKRYGSLFTCLTTRAIHLELAFDLSSSFINVLRRFLARRGLVEYIYSDNGSNFVGAEHILKDSFLKSQDTNITSFPRQQETT